MTMTIPPFESKNPDPALLEDKDQGTERLITDYETIRIRHPRVNHTLQILKRSMRKRSGANLILLLGPTGVGKSTLVNSMKKMVIEDNKQKILTDSSFIPIVVVDAIASGERRFAWRSFYERVGNALHEPLLDQKCETWVRDGREWISKNPKGSTVAALRDSIETAIKRRRTEILILDEAVHLFRNTSFLDFEAELHALKSISNTFGVVVVLVGSYDLFRIVSSDAQIARRIKVVHFSRYRPDVEEDVKAFRNTLNELQRHFPIHGIPDLTKFSDRLQIATVGCIGTLKETLEGMLERVLEDGGEWRMEHLEGALLTKQQILTIQKEALEGEEEISNCVFETGTFDSLDDLLIRQGRTGKSFNSVPARQRKKPKVV